MIRLLAPLVPYLWSLPLLGSVRFWFFDCRGAVGFELDRSSHLECPFSFMAVFALGLLLLLLVLLSCWIFPLICRLFGWLVWGALSHAPGVACAVLSLFCFRPSFLERPCSLSCMPAACCLHIAFCLWLVCLSALLISSAP